MCHLEHRHPDDVPVQPAGGPAASYAQPADVLSISQRPRSKSMIENLPLPQRVLAYSFNASFCANLATST